MRSRFSSISLRTIMPADVMNIVANNIYIYGIRGEGESSTKRAAVLMEMKHFDVTLIHSFHMNDLPEAIR